MKLGAFVTTHHRPGVLRNTLERLLRQTRPPAYILVIDNGSGPEAGAVTRGFEPTRVGYHRMGYNSGPAGAGAYGLRRLADEGFDWILCGDDDDPPLTDDTVERLLRVVETAEPPLGMVGATGTPWDWSQGRRVLRFALPERGICYVDVVGGSKLPIVSRAVVDQVGVPNPALFFGYDDFDYCLRIRRAGFRIAIDAELFRQYVGALQPEQRKSRPRGTPRPRDEIWRQYYSTRNYIHFMRREFGNERLAFREAVNSLLRIVVGWTQGIEYGAAFTRLQLWAVVDGYRGKLGLTVPPQQKYPAPTATRPRSCRVVRSP
jgi:glycosyltransferase involved in cell wall biosynthesis